MVSHSTCPMVTNWMCILCADHLIRLINSGREPVRFGPFLRQSFRVNPLLDTPDTLSQVVAGLKPDQHFGFGHIKAQLLSLGHTPWKAEFDLDSRKHALNRLDEFIPGSRPRADAVEDLAGRRGMFRRRE